SLEGSLGAKGDLDGIVALYREALKRHPGQEWAHQGLARALSGKRDWDGVTKVVRKAAKLFPWAAWPHQWLGDLRSDKGDLSGALASYSKAIALGNGGISWWARGGTYRKLGQWDKALADYTKAIDMMPHLAAQVLLDRGVMYGESGRWDKAVEDCTRCLEMRP